MEVTKINKTKILFSRKDTARNKLQFRLINVVIKAGQSSRETQRRGNMQLGVHMGVGRVVKKGFLGDGGDKKRIWGKPGRMCGGNSIGGI